MAVSLVIMPALIAGAAIGVYEALLIHRDVRIPTHRFGHTIHASVYAIVASFAVFNVDFVYGVFNFLHTWPIIGTALIFRIIIGLITVVKIHGASAAIRGSIGSSVGLKETWFHSILIGALVVAAPYVWPFISPLLPVWMR